MEYLPQNKVSKDSSDDGKYFKQRCGFACINIEDQVEYVNENDDQSNKNKKRNKAIPDYYYENIDSTES